MVARGLVWPVLAALTLAWAFLPADARAAQEGTLRIFAPPPLAWNADMTTSRPALHQTMSDFAALAGGLRFGMPPQQVNARLPEPIPDLSWPAMPMAGEYPADIRYFWTRLDAAGGLNAGIAHCAGEGSHLVFLFSAKGLFRLSYRLLPDRDCPDATEAARDILARYAGLGTDVAYSMRYRTNGIEIVDITDPTAGFLIPVRWRQGAN